METKNLQFPHVFGKGPAGALFLLMFLSFQSLAKPYISLPEDCDGFPKLPLVTQDKLCVGLLLQKSEKIALRMPRSAVELPNGQLLVVDMGGWDPNLGKLWLIDFRAKVPTAKILLSQLNLPHKIVRGADGQYYLGEVHRLIRFGVNSSTISTPALFQLRK